jgi:hypothetical protein
MTGILAALPTVAGASFCMMLAHAPFRNGTRVGIVSSAAVALLSIGALWWHRRLSPPSGFPLLLAAVAGVLFTLAISCVWSIAPDYSWDSFTKEHLWFLLLTAAVALWGTTVGRQRWILCGLALAGILSAIPGISLYYAAPSLQRSGWIESAGDYLWEAQDASGVPYRRAKGMLESYTRSAIVFVFAIPAMIALLPAAYASRHRWILTALLVIGLGLSLFYMLLTKSRGPLLACAIATGVLLLLMRIRWWILAAPIAALALLLAALPAERARLATLYQHLHQPNLLLSGRLELWSEGLTIIRENPLLGVGYGGNILLQPAALDRGYGLHSDRAQPDLHQVYLQTLAEVGIIGFLAYLLLVVVLLSLAVRILWSTPVREAPGTAVAFSVAVGMLAFGFVYAFNERHIALMLWTTAGLLAARVAPTAPLTQPAAPATLPPTQSDHGASGPPPPDSSLHRATRPRPTAHRSAATLSRPLRRDALPSPPSARQARTLRQRVV